MSNDFLPILKIQKLAAFMALVSVGVALFLWPSVAVVGGLIIVSVLGLYNFRFLAKLISKLVTDTEDQNLKWGGLFLIKMLGLMGIVALLLLKTSINPVALLAGFGCVIVSVVIQGFRLSI
ncbi:MAG TPA: hypothetical protein DDW49_03580 [Deltaproteobacteria bacterium]|nr:hypothetical protein [Deltaproteobacteria bacterium]